MMSCFDFNFKLINLTLIEFFFSTKVFGGRQRGTALGIVTVKIYDKDSLVN